MKIFEIKDDEDRVFSFEVSNTFLTRRKVCKIASEIPGVKIIREPKPFSPSQHRDDDFCEFEIGGVRFEVSEPFGDNSRYWIGPKATEWTPQCDLVREGFLRA